ncbi:MAG: SDR family oxidoreductase [Alphaproteobacteria bacterium]|jgi:NAD(P)-dependent dehydrogenase (short-subunit alcohol dehydrogenase family)|nr:SDR family oxidoreductase [Alphaproteobacteria bacterium]MDP6567475.1 SDR family oxidoreductase [Alphaproteobacteria bacterium]MDP6815335.1 SDR family oxidoreductase [Alphaproteobacteria bacterium]
MELFDLAGQVAIVTGSTKGIGKAIAARMCQHGAKVVVSSRKADMCEAVTAEINKDYAANGGEAISIPAHVGVEEDLSRLVNGTLDKWGKITTLVPNAAVNPYYGPSAEMPESALDKILEINVKGVFKLCHMVLPGMVEQGGGAIIIIASNSGLKGSVELCGYAISKVAEHQIARNLAVEFGPLGIRVNAIAPGLIKTDFAKTLWTNPKRLERVEKLLPLRRIGDPDDIAGTAVFLASPAAAFLTGQVVNVDGGNAIV